MTISVRLIHSPEQACNCAHDWYLSLSFPGSPLNMFLGKRVAGHRAVTLQTLSTPSIKGMLLGQPVYLHRLAPTTHLLVGDILDKGRVHRIGHMRMLQAGLLSGRVPLSLNGHG